jgi:iron complex outermembrane receptor protein
LRIPLVNPADQIPGLRGLSLSVAARHDDYSDFGRSTNPQYALVWTPHESIFVRLSYGTAFRPPSLFELYSPRIETLTQLTDPLRNESLTATRIIGGNPDLGPFEADAFSARLVFSPQEIHGLSASMTYWQVEIDQRIAVFSIPILMQNEARFPERVLRAAPTPADQAAGLPGRVISIDTSRINFGRLDTSGIDFSVDLSHDTRFGKVHSGFSATWVREYSSVNLPGAAPEERVGVASAAAGTILRWNAAATLGWTAYGVSASATARYAPSYADAIPGAQRNGRTVASQTLVDVQLAYEFAPQGGDKSDVLSGLRISVGATNLLDKDPPFSESTGGGYDRSQANVLGRFAYLTLSKRF